MRTAVVNRTSVFPADRRRVFELLQKPETLQYIARPYASFTQEDGGGMWREGETYRYRMKIGMLIPFGTHTINVIRFSETEGIYTREGNRHVPVWNHSITLKSLGERSCEYTDTVEIGAGWKTPLIYLWAGCFYAHRQRKWIKLLNNAGPAYGRHK